MTGRPRLLVNAAELLRQPGARRDISAESTLEDLDVDDDRLAGPVSLDLHAESALDHIAVTGEMRVGWSDVCRRCLRPLADTLVVTVDERYAEADPTGMRTVDPEAFPTPRSAATTARACAPSAAPTCRPDPASARPPCGTSAGRHSTRCATSAPTEGTSVEGGASAA
jgi:uncharacterized protein